MREIKFRAWLKSNNLMYDVLCIDTAEKKALIERGDMRGYAKYPDETILMQCIGLKDKNGKDIYEGDIVKAISFARWIGVVEYSDENQAFIFDDLDKKYRGKSTVFMNQFDDGFEILGNIYGNPDIRCTAKR